MKKIMGNPKPLPPHLKAELERLEAEPDSTIDLSEIPLIENWSTARRGPVRHTKQPRTVIIDQDIADWFYSNGDGYQVQINSILRDYVREHSKAKG